MRKSPWENREFAKLSLSHVDSKFTPGTKQEVDFLECELAVKPGEKILDLGCGSGRHSIEFAKRGYDVIGIDISAPMLEEAKKRARKARVAIKFYREDLSQLEHLFKEGKLFSGAVCLCESGFGVLGGWEEDLDFLKSVNNLLEVGRKLILTNYNGLRKYKGYKPDHPFDYIHGIVHWQGYVNEGKTLLKEEQRVYIPSELTMIFQLAGFSEIKIFGCSPGHFAQQELRIDDIEMMIIGAKDDSDSKS